MTIKELINYLQSEVLLGNGNNHVLLSSDAEGNSIGKLGEHSFSESYVRNEDLTQSTVDLINEDEDWDEEDKEYFKESLEDGSIIKVLVLFP